MTKLKTKLKTKLYVEELLPVCRCWHGANVMFAKNLVANCRDHVVAKISKGRWHCQEELEALGCAIELTNDAQGSR